MSLKTRLEADLKSALLAGDKSRAEILRGLKAAILNEEVAKGQRESGLDDQSVEQVIARELKKRRESAGLYRQNDRADLAESEEVEAQVLETYLPKQLDEPAVRAAVAKAIAATGASDVKAMGQVIGAVKAQHGTAVDGALLAQIVKELLER